MYEQKEKRCFWIAIIYWIIYMIALFLMGYLFSIGFPYYNIVYYGLFAGGILTVLIRDRNLCNLGFTGEKLKKNLLIAVCIIAAAFCVSVFRGQYPVVKLAKQSVYYLLYVSLIEEMMFRGFIQNYLFGLKTNKHLTFFIGALMFALMHLPFQMFVSGNVSAGYILTALPNLLSCVVCHMVMCYITDRRKDITIPVALHYVIDYMYFSM